MPSSSPAAWAIWRTSRDGSPAVTNSSEDRGGSVGPVGGHDTNQGRLTRPSRMDGDGGISRTKTGSFFMLKCLVVCFEKGFGELCLALGNGEYPPVN